MSRTLAAVVVALSLSSSAALADSVRTVDGDRVDTDDYIVMAFSIEDTESIETLRQLDGINGVLAVNTDAASARSQVTHFLRNEGLEIPVVCDPVLLIDESEYASPSQIATVLKIDGERTVAMSR